MTSQKVAVVTGASSGIGAATTRLLAENGYRVISTARRADRLAELAKSSSNIETFVADLTVQSDVDALAAFCSEKPVEVLINAAGGAFDAATVLEGDPEAVSYTHLTLPTNREV